MLFQEMEKVVENYQIKDLLFSIPPRAYHIGYNNSETQYLIQAIPKRQNYQTIKYNVLNLKQINHLNVLRHFDFLETNTNIYIVTEYCHEGVLANELNELYMQENKAKDYLRQVLRGMKKLHEFGICSFDLSLNSIFKRHNAIKIGQVNLGLMEMQKCETNEDFEQFGLIKEIFAPEVLKGEKDTLSSNLYMVGLFYYRLLYGRYPFTAPTKKLLIEEMMKQNIDFNAENNCRISKESIQFLKQILIFDKSKRINWAKMYDLPLLHILNNTPSSRSFSEQSLTISQTISFHDLNQLDFEISKMAKFYQNQGEEISPIIEVSIPVEIVNIINILFILRQNQLMNHKDSDLKSINSFDFSIAIVENQFKESRALAFKAQIQYFISLRNIYAYFAQILSFTRIIPKNDFFIKQLNFMILKTINIVSLLLFRQLDDLNQEIVNFKDEEIADLFENFYNLRKKIEIERILIEIECTNSLKILKRTMKNLPDVEPALLNSMNDISKSSLEHFELLNRMFLKYVQFPQSYEQCFKDDPLLPKIFQVKMISYLIIIFLYLEFRSDDVKNILGEDIDIFLEKLEQMSMNQLEEKLQKNIKILQRIFSDFEVHHIQ